MLLSKSEYMMYLKHPAWLWLKKYDKKKLPEVSADLQAMFDAGHEFEASAEAHFPDGVQLGFDSYFEYLSLPARTTQALEGGTKTIFQGRFEHLKTTFICDVVRVVGDNELDLYEIKSSTSVKSDHIVDLAFQVTVLEGCGYRVRSVYVMHVDNSYTRNSEVDSKQIVATEDVSEDVKRELPQTQRNIEGAIKVMEGAKMPDPSPSLAQLGSLEEWLEVYKNIVPVPDGSIYELCRLNTNTLQLLEAEGITKLADIPLELVSVKQQRWQLEALKKGEPIYDTKKLSKFLADLEYPLYFFDYETLSSTVPYFDGTRPYQQVPFQYSLHVIDSPGAELKQMGYLHSDNTNPAKPLSAALKSQIGQEGTIITWNMSFEKSCNTLLGNMLPEYREFYEGLNDRINDLMLPFRNGLYVDAKFGGSASIKKVLPVLVPELSYKNLGIQEGGSAQRSWMDAVLYGTRAGEKEQILKDLEEYCALDTLAMVEIYRFLVDTAGGKTPDNYKDTTKSNDGPMTEQPEQLSIKI